MAAATVVDPGELQLLRQPVLQGAERPLAAAARLRRVGGDVADAQLLQRPADLGQLGLGDLPARRGRVEVVAAPVGVELDEQPVPLDHLGQAAKRRRRALLLDQDGRVDRRGRVVERDHQVQRRLPGQPGMASSASWCSIMPTIGRRGRFLRWAPRLGAAATAPLFCSHSRVVV